MQALLRHARVAALSVFGLAGGCQQYGLAPSDLFDGGADAPATGPAPELDAPEDSGMESTALTWTELNANIVEGDVVSIWGTSAGDVYVGTDMQSIYRIVNGSSQWTGISTPVVGGGWGSDPGNVYAVGSTASNPALASAGGIFRFQSEVSWTPVASGTFYAIWGSSAEDVYGAGSAGILRAGSDGNFTAQTSSAAISIWGSGATDVYAGTADGSILHSAGDGNWQSVASAPGPVWSGWSAGPGNAYAIAETSTGKDPTCAVVHTRDGQTWTTESFSTNPTTLVGIWGSGPQDVYVCGWHVGEAGIEGDLFHSRGDGTWSRVALPGSPWQIHGVWGTSATNVFLGMYDAEDGPVVLVGQP